MKKIEEKAVSFEVVGNYVFCLRYLEENGALECKVYTAVSDPTASGELGFEERYNLVDIDGNIVEDFENAGLILVVTDVLFHENEVFFELTFNGDYSMNYPEFEAIHGLFEDSIRPGLKQFAGNE